MKGDTFTFHFSLFAIFHVLKKEKAMFDWLTGTLFGKYVFVFFASMVPVMELRGAIPIGVGLGLPLVPTIVTCILGNLVPAPFIVIFIRGIFDWMRHRAGLLGKFVAKMEDKARSKQDLLEKYELFGLFILVAIPLPGTGAWTGSLVAAFFGIPWGKAMPPIAAGVVSAGLIIGILTGGVTALM